MEKTNEIKLPEGVDRIAVKQYDDKIVIEFIPEEPKFKRGDILISTVEPDLTVIFDKMTPVGFDSIYNSHLIFNDAWNVKKFRHATKEEKQEFFDKLKADGKRWNAEAMEIEDILKKGDLAIFWGDNNLNPTIRLYHFKSYNGHSDNFGTIWGKAVKWDGTKEQFEKVLRGEIK